MFLMVIIRLTLEKTNTYTCFFSMDAADVYRVYYIGIFLFLWN